MTEKRKKQTTASIIDSAPTEHFMSEFLTHCEHHFVDPLPFFSVVDSFPEVFYPVSHFELVTKSAGDLSDISEQPYSPTQDNRDVENPPIFVTFENPKNLSSPKKIVCKGYEITIFCLDALNATLPSYKTITVLKLQNCQINAYGIEIIAEMLMKTRCIRDLNLDMNPNLRENYYLLCSSAGKLQFLSLRLCKISDNCVKKISEILKFQDPPNEPKLIGLNLANNHITDLGTQYISTMLRTNRSLQSLNLSSNRIQDTGAAAIINELCIIKLTHSEIVELRRRHFARLLFQDKIQEENQVKSVENPKNSEVYLVDRENSTKIKIQNLKRPQTSQLLRKSSKIHRQNSFLKGHQEYFGSTDNLLDYQESDSHPLKKESRPMKGEIISIGNLNLQHLNFSFNPLTNKTLNKLISCLYYQDYMMLDDLSQGLLYINLEGTDFEKENDLWTQFKDLLSHRRREESKVQNINFGSKISADSINLRNEIKKGFSSSS